MGRGKEYGCCVFRGWVGLGRTGEEEEEEEECTPAMYRWEGRGGVKRGTLSSFYGFLDVEVS